jgi:hypothetical protein
MFNSFQYKLYRLKIDQRNSWQKGLIYYIVYFWCNKVRQQQIHTKTKKLENKRKKYNHH